MIALKQKSEKKTKKCQNAKETKKYLCFISNRFIDIELCVNMYFVINFLS